MREVRPFVGRVWADTERKLSQVLRGFRQVLQS